jgi:adenylate cyclase
MFTDIDGFTTLAEALPPEALMRLASDYFQEVTQTLLAQQATIDKYIGDAVMALWNAPRDDPQHARHACLAALSLRVLTDAMCRRFAAEGRPPLPTRIGLHTGEAVVGNLGGADRLSYTAIGGMVNIASRLEGLNKFYGTRTLISEATRRAAGPGFVTRPVDLVQVKGAREVLEVHELLGLAPAAAAEDKLLVVAPARCAALPAWAAMIAAYRAGDITAASRALAAAGDPAGDPLLQYYAARLARLRDTPPGADWSPVTRHLTK